MNGAKVRSLVSLGMLLLLAPLVSSADDVYTDRDLEQYESGEEPPNVSPFRQEEGGNEDDAFQDREYGGHGESWWRSAFQRIVDEMKGLQGERESILEQLDINERKGRSLEYAWSQGRSFPSRDRPLDRERDMLREKLAGVEERYREAEIRFEQLKGRAARAAVPMHWRVYP